MLRCVSLEQMIFTNSMKTMWSILPIILLFHLSQKIRHPFAKFIKVILIGARSVNMRCHFSLWPLGVCIILTLIILILLPVVTLHRFSNHWWQSFETFNSGKQWGLEKAVQLLLYFSNIYLILYTSHKLQTTIISIIY